LFGDKMLSATDKAEQRVEGAGLKRDCAAGTAKEAVSGVEFEPSEEVGGIDRALILV
jgi:hypothetical protein